MTNPLEALTCAIGRKAAGQELSTQDITRLRLQINQTELAECENAQALLLSLEQGISYAQAILAIANSSTTDYED